MKTEQITWLLDKISASPTSFHAVHTVCGELAANGFTRLSENEKWNLQSGKGYYVTRNQSSVIAFRLPEGEYRAFQITASHSDSPSFKLKEMAELVTAGHYVQLNTERYGGMLCASWFDRPLSIAGRVMVRENGRIVSRLYDSEDRHVLIPNLAIHMNRQANDGYTYNAQTDMLPLFGDENAKDSLLAEIASKLGVSESEIVGTDLFLYNPQQGMVWGNDGCYLSAPRLDDLECAFGTLAGFLRGKSDNLNVYCLFDNEEVGSTTRQGAASTFLADVLRRVHLALGRGEEDFYTCLAGSFMISADNAHAVHPNHPEKSDQTNRTHMNGGIVVKFSANQKYTTDAASRAVFGEICRSAGVPVQYFANRSDMAGGSTLGNISGTQVSVATVDIGLPQLAMHSSYETAGTADVEYLITAIEAFYQTTILPEGDGFWRIG